MQHKSSVELSLLNNFNKVRRLQRTKPADNGVYFTHFIIYIFTLNTRRWIKKENGIRNFTGNVMLMFTSNQPDSVLHKLLDDRVSSDVVYE